MIVVFDSNVWLSELGLRSTAGAVARFFLNHRGARLAIPEVVKLEVQHNLRALLTAHIDGIRTRHRHLLTAFGKLPEIVLPSDEDVQAKVEEVFASVGVPKMEVPLTLESARSSFLKTIDKLPPSDRDQQFKDGVLWAGCLEMLGSDSVALVTSDKAFYQDRQYEKGLARNLRDEASHRPNQIELHSALSSLLKTLRTTVTLDENGLAEAFLTQYRESVNGTLARHGFDLGLRQALTYTLYATEDPGVLFLDFSMEFECTEVRAEGRMDATLRLKGDGSYRPTSGQFTELRNFGDHLSYRMPDGTERVIKNAVMYAAGLVLGHREISNIVRYNLSDDQG